MSESCQISLKTMGFEIETGCFSEKYFILPVFLNLVLNLISR